MTRIRGEFAVTPQVEAAVNEFLVEDMQNQRLYTTAQYVLPAVEFHQKYDRRELAAREERVQKLARGTLVLGKLQRAHMYSNKSVRLFFSVRPEDQPRLDKISELIGESISKGEHVQHELYAELLPGMLSEDREKVQNAMGKLASQLRHPNAARHMHTKEAFIKWKNIPDYLTGSFLPGRA